jgi:phage terminase large subunit GpA-like protein
LIEGWGITAFGVDSGYRTAQVYDWCEQRLGVAFATKGKDAPLKLYSMSDVEVMRSGQKLKRALKLTTFDHGYFKGWVHDRVRWPQGQPGAWHLPRGVGEDYCRQLVGESRMRLASGKTVWVKRSTNDMLDAEAIQVLLANMHGVKNLQPPEAAPVVPQRGVRSPGVQM